MYDSAGNHFHKDFVKSAVENLTDQSPHLVHTPQSRNYLLNYVIVHLPTYFNENKNVSKY